MLVISDKIICILARVGNYMSIDLKIFFSGTKINLSRNIHNLNLLNRLVPSFNIKIQYNTKGR